MPKDSAQRVKDHRERKLREARRAGDPTDTLPGPKFFEYVNESGDWTEVEYYLDWLGIASSAWPQFSNDEDPGYLEGVDEGPYRGSIGRAERMVGFFLDAAINLASSINDYKKKKIDDAIKALESSDMTDPEQRKLALQEIVRLNKLREQLIKKVRWELPQWRVTNIS